MTPPPRAPAPFRRWVRGRRVLVLGLGRSGLSAARLLASLGARAAVSERRARREIGAEAANLPPGTRLETGGHALTRRWRPALIVASPGVPWDLPALQEARRRGTPVWSELGLGLALIRPAAIAAVTGTNGKTTTTALLGRMMTGSGRPVVTAGNIGTPLTSLTSRITSRSLLILEVSSYQIEGLEGFRPDVGCVLNVTPDHLARHGTLERYAAVKFRLFTHQNSGDWAILNADDPFCRALAAGCPGRVLWVSASRPLPGQAYAGPEGLVLDQEIPPLRLPPPRRLIGPHNLFNALAAAACARALGAGPSALSAALRDFKGVPHRCEPVAAANGVLYVNDSKATNVDSTAVALRAFNRPLLLILGGRHKGAPYTPLRPLLAGHVRKTFLIGEAAPLIEKDLRGSVALEQAYDLERAVSRAREEARPGEAVLLSPACASFDQFRDFEHRGETFRRLVLLPRDR